MLRQAHWWEDKASIDDEQDGPCIARATLGPEELYQTFQSIVENFNMIVSTYSMARMRMDQWATFW